MKTSLILFTIFAIVCSQQLLQLNCSATCRNTSCLNGVCYQYIGQNFFRQYCSLNFTNVPNSCGNGFPMNFQVSSCNTYSCKNSSAGCCVNMTAVGLCQSSLITQTASCPTTTAATSININSQIINCVGCPHPLIATCSTGFCTQSSNVSMTTTNNGTAVNTNTTTNACSSTNCGSQFTFQGNLSQTCAQACPLSSGCCYSTSFAGAVCSSTPIFTYYGIISNDICQFLFGNKLVYLLWILGIAFMTMY